MYKVKTVPVVSVFTALSPHQIKNQNRYDHCIGPVTLTTTCALSAPPQNWEEGKTANLTDNAAHSMS